jgi:hypothetical protein
MSKYQGSDLQIRRLPRVVSGAQMRLYHGRIWPRPPEVGKGLVVVHAVLGCQRRKALYGGRTRRSSTTAMAGRKDAIQAETGVNINARARNNLRLMVLAQGKRETPRCAPRTGRGVYHPQRLLREPCRLSLEAHRGGPALGGLVGDRMARRHVRLCKDKLSARGWNRGA